MRVQRITNDMEALVERVLSGALADTEWAVLPKLPVQTALTKEAEWLSDPEFSMYTRGHFDFTVCRDRVPAFVIEFDGFGHDDPAQVARDIIKNRLCAMAQLPLLRIGLAELHQPDQVNVLEWLVKRFVSWQEGTTQRQEILADHPRATPRAVELDMAVFLHLEQPFLGNLVVAHRLFDQFGIACRTKEFEFLEQTAFKWFWLVREFESSWGDAPYQLEVDWPGELPVFEDGTVSEFMSSKTTVVLRKSTQPGVEVFRTTGHARFAWAHKTEGPAPTGPHAYMPSTEQIRALGLAAQDLPWLDPSAATAELSIYDALSRVERWAEHTLS